MTFPADLSRADLVDLIERAWLLLDDVGRADLQRHLLNSATRPPSADVALSALEEAVPALHRWLALNLGELSWSQHHWGEGSPDLEDEASERIAAVDDFVQITARALAADPAGADLAERVQAVLEQLDDASNEAGDAGVPAAELLGEFCDDRPLRFWLASLNPLTISERVSHMLVAWPEPPERLPAQLQVGDLDVIAQLEARACSGDARAARWHLRLEPDADVARAHMIRYAPLSRDLTATAVQVLEAREDWDGVQALVDRGAPVAESARYQALLHRGQAREAWVRVLSGAWPLSLAAAWKDASDRQDLPWFRRQARTSPLYGARWIALDESELAALPTPYDHDQAKAVTLYAAIRATGGLHEAPIFTLLIEAELLKQVALEGTPTRPEWCAEVALDGYRRMIQFHIDSRKRNRYRRAAAYWAAHDALALQVCLHASLERIRMDFARERARLPALRDELRQAGVRG